MPDRWQETVAFATDIRRQLHENPELPWEEEQTADLIRRELTRLKIPWRACAGTGTVATLNSAQTGAAIALRADIDALPLHDCAGQRWSSRVPGKMHACGHDGHTATLLAAAAWLKHHESRLEKPVVLLFQPAEEGGHGALEMIKDGALEGAGSIFGWHNWPAMPLGQLVCPDSTVMAGNGTFQITLRSDGGHASQPELTGDTILGASAVTMALQQIVSRRLAAQSPAVVSVTSIDGRSGPTVIPEKVVVSGSIRVPDEAVRQRINQLIPEVAGQTACAYGVTAETELFPRYSPTVNHAGPAALVREAWVRCYGVDSLNRELALPVMASEDFSYYLQEIPGAFALIGSAGPDPSHQAPLHSPYYDFNDALIPRVARLFAELAGIPAATT